MDSVPAAAKGVGIPQPVDECPLKSMPPEIRNRIYTFTFALELDAKVELLDAKPPLKALLLTCRQIYEEAKHMYGAAHRQFWSITQFQISLPETKPAYLSVRKDMCDQIRSMHARHLCRVEILEIDGRGFKFRFQRGVWYDEERSHQCCAIIENSDRSAMLHALDRWGGFFMHPVDGATSTRLTGRIGVGEALERAIKAIGASSLTKEALLGMVKVFFWDCT